MASSSSSSPPLSITDLVDLIHSTSHGSTLNHTLPSSDAILATLNTRYKAEHPYINCGYSTLISINPLRPLENINDESARFYAGRIQGEDDEDDQDDDEDEQAGGAKSPKRKNLKQVPPHPYEFAARIHLALQRTGKSQGVVFR